MPRKKGDNSFCQSEEWCRNRTTFVVQGVETCSNHLASQIKRSIDDEILEFYKNAGKKPEENIPVDVSLK